MKILIFGASGPIGFNLFENFKMEKHEVEGTYLKNKPTSYKFHELDVTNKEETIGLIKKNNPELVIDCVALAGVELAERDKKLADLVTVEGTKNIVKGCQFNDSKIIYLSSSYVYGDLNKINHETSKTDPSTYYGKTKLMAEENIIDSDLDYLIIRTDQPYTWTKTWQRENSVTRLIRTIKDKKKFNEIIDWYNNPSYIPDITKSIGSLINKNKTGVFNVVGSDYVNRYDWSCKVAKTFGLDTNLINPINSSELQISVKRPNINSSNEKLFQETGIKMKGILDGAIDLKKNIN